ncbi:MAG: hypothetical protein DRR15_17040 [Gammaproteobacteria bacterium]|nr:MAG: hypothetical protein DRR15_17040 [Gammaproteobacteria bacterium]
MVARIKPQHRSKIYRLLDGLSAAETLKDLDIPGWNLHRLKGKPIRYALKVQKNWRVTFAWKDGEAHEVDYEDYH